jgi:hypothetical protein
MLSARLNFGVNSLDPSIAGDEIQFSRLVNLQPRKGRLYVATSYGETEDLGTEAVNAFGSYTVPTDLYSALYAITDTSIFNYNFSTNLFTTPAIYTGFASGNLPYAVIPWYDRVYVTKKDAPMVKLQGPVATVMSTMPRARYGVVSANHLMLANIQSDSENLPTRIRWSDLYLPESFDFAEDSEADYFDLEPTDEEITGLSYQRGSNVIYSRTSVWVAQYSNGLYRFDPLFTGLGNIYHGGHVRIKEVDYFIGQDNFYALDGFQLKPIGDKIWSFFVSTIYDQTEPTIRTIVRPDREEVEWIYPQGIDGFRSIVFNYKTGEWSDKEPQNTTSFYSSVLKLRGFDTIDSNSNVIDTVASAIDGAWQFDTATRKAFYGGNSGKVYSIGEVFSDYDTSSLEASAQTFEITMGKLFETKEFTRLTLLYTGYGTPVVSLLVGHRKHLMESVTWSSSIAMSDQLPGETTFHFRNNGVGRLVTFKIVITNTATNYVTELTHLEIDFVDVANDNPEE